MHSDNKQKIELSEDGQHRRHQMLSELQRTVRMTAGQRKKRRSAISHTLFLALIGLIILVAIDPRAMNPGPSVDGSDSGTSPPPASMFPVAEVVVNSQPDVTRKYLVRSIDIDQFSFSFETVDDDSLQKTLAEAGRETLVAKIDNQLVLWEPN